MSTKNLLLSYVIVLLLVFSLGFLYMAVFEGGVSRANGLLFFGVMLLLTLFALAVGSLLNWFVRGLSSKSDEDKGEKVVNNNERPIGDQAINITPESVYNYKKSFILKNGVITMKKMFYKHNGEKFYLYFAIRTMNMKDNAGSKKYGPFYTEDEMFKCAKDKYNKWKNV